MADNPTVHVPFSIPADAPSAADGDFVIKDVPLLFSAGVYPFSPEAGGPFSMTTEDIRAAIDNFPPEGVKLSDEHNVRSIFYRRGLGTFFAPKASADFTSFGGKLRVKRPVLDLLGPGPLKLSANFCRATKCLRDVSLTESPRIQGAAAFAAFAAFAKSEGATPDTTPHGKAAMQALHDMSAQAGALCGNKEEAAEDVAAGASAGMAAFTSQHERDALQAVHDTATGMGATCAVKKGKAQEQAEAAMSAYTAEMIPPSAREKELEARLAAVEQERAAEKEAAKKAAEAHFAARVASFASEAATFADSLRDRLLPYMRPLCVADYCRSAEDDLRDPAEVHFSTAEGKAWKGSRLEACKVRWQALPPHGLGGESLASRTDLTALFAKNDGTPAPMTEERRRQLLAYTPIGQAVLKDQRRANGK